MLVWVHVWYVCGRLREMCVCLRIHLHVFALHALIYRIGDEWSIHIYVVAVCIFS